MNNTNTTNNNNNNMITITFFYSGQSIPSIINPLLKNSDNAYILQLKYIKIEKHYWLRLNSKVPTDDCFAGLLIGDFALLLCCSESRTRSRNSTIVPNLEDLSSVIFMFTILYALKFFDW